MERGGDLGSALDGVTALLSISRVYSFVHTEGWQQFRAEYWAEYKCPVYSGGTLECKCSRVMCRYLHWKEEENHLRGPTLESREWSGGLADAQAREK